MSDLLLCEGRARPDVVGGSAACCVCEFEEDAEIREERALLKEMVLEEEIAFVGLWVVLD